jgi:hypothetical protein
MKKTRALIIIVAVLIVIAVIIGTRMFAVIGDEGFVAYDPLLYSSYTPALWGVGPASALVTTSLSGITFQGNVFSGATSSATCSCSGRPTAPCSEPYTCGGGQWMASMVTDYSWMCYDPYGTAETRCDPYSFKTANLAKTNIKFNYAAGPAQYYSRYDSSSADIIVDGIPVNLMSCSYAGYPSTHCGASLSSTSGNIEIKWSDYEVGKFQIFKDGAYVAEGIDTDNNFAISFLPAPVSHNQGSAYITVSDFRIKQLFGCDEKDGELLASITVKGPAGINTNVLPGFKRFCVDHPTAYLNAGVSGSRTGPYYAMAQGDTVLLQSNQAEMYFYIADAAALGVSQKCAAGAYDVNKNQCQDITGIINLCPVGQQQSDGSCLVLVRNEIKIDDRVELTGAKTVVWNANYRRQELKSGTTKLLYTNAPEYVSGGSCSVADSNQHWVFDYPEPSSACWKLKMNAVLLNPDAPNAIGQYFETTIKSAQAMIKYEKDNGLFYEYEQIDDWQVTYESKLVQDPFVITGSTAKTEYGLGETAEYVLSIENKYSAPLKARVINVIASDILGQEFSSSKIVTLAPGMNQVTVPVYSGTLGFTNNRYRVMLDTEAGVLDGSLVYLVNYDIKGSLSCPQSSTWNEAMKRCEIIPALVCPEGSNFNQDKLQCEHQLVVNAQCPTGFVRDEQAMKCNLPIDSACPAQFAWDSVREVCARPIDQIEVKNNQLIIKIAAAIIIVLAGGIIVLLSRKK